MTVLDFLPLFAGIGLFLYGMGSLSTALEKAAGGGLEKTLEKLTNNRLKGLLLGTGVTAVIQSSSATIIMLIGLMNAGIIKLAQAVPVIMGANIGTTITGQILRLGDIGDSSLWLSLLKPSSFGPILIAIGAVLFVFCKDPKKQVIGNACISLGMIFFGMSTMEKTLSPLGQQAWFQNMVVMFKNPMLGIMLGLVMTAIIQSSSASVGILQAMSATGLITFSTAIPIILGQNIGKCLPVILVAFGSKKDSKRAILLDFLINTLGVILFTVVIYTYQSLIGFSFWDTVVNRGDIANFHTLFSVVTSLVLIFFSNQLIAFAKRAIKEEKQSAVEGELARLDDLLIKTPVMAVRQARQVVISMGETALENFKNLIDLFTNYSEANVSRIMSLESMLDKTESALNNYVQKVASEDLNVNDARRTTEILHTIINFERIGDYIVNIVENLKYNKDHKIHLSVQAKKELRTILLAVSEVLELTVDMYKKDDILGAYRVEPLEEVIDELQTVIKDKYIERLRTGLCDEDAGTFFLEMISALERISDHCSNIAVNEIQYLSHDTANFSSHKLLKHIHSEPTEEYMAAYKEYADKYKVV